MGGGWFVRVCAGLFGCVSVCWGVLRFVRFAKNCWGLLKVVGVCFGVLGFANGLFGRAETLLAL